MVGNRQHGKVGKQCYIVARGIVLSSLGHAVVLIELAKQLLEQRSHGVVVKCRNLLFAFVIEYRGYTQVDTFVGHLVDHHAQTVYVVELLHIVAQVKLGDDILHMLAESVEVGPEVE